MKIEELLAGCQYLYHMAEDGSWPSINTYGLLSTSALLIKWEYPEKEREAICCMHRPNSIPIEHKVYGRAVLRDQKAIDPRKLRSCLTDMMEEEWYRLLNSRVFFWTEWQRLKWFLGATAYINKPHVVVTIDTRRLLGQYADQVTLSPINTGSTFLTKNHDSPEPRGRGTLKRIPEYQMSWVRELAVDNGVQNIVSFTLSVDRLVVRKKNAEPEKLASLWPSNDQ